MMKMRATYVPEDLRATIINLFRIPLNLFVCIVLYNVEAIPLYGMFGVCVGLLVLSFLCQLRLEQAAPAAGYTSKIATSDEEDNRSTSLADD